MRIIYKLLVFVLFFALTSRGYSQQYDFSQLSKTLESKQTLLGKDLVVLVWKDDSLIFKKQLGDFNAKTVAPIGQASMWLTAALVMQFVDEGKISLDDKIARWIPEFERYGKNYITIRHCLTHMTGIRDDGGQAKKNWQRKKYSSLEEEVNSFAARDIRVNAGDDFWYGTVGLNTAARVLEIISKKKFDVLIKQKLLTPLAMRRTTFSTLDASAIDPSAGAQTTAEEYLKFLAMLLNNGKVGDKQILSPESVAELRKVNAKDGTFKYAPKAATGFSYALGSWSLEDNDGVAQSLACFSLSGSWPMVNFSKGYASIVLTKSAQSEERDDIHMEIKGIVDEVIKK